MQLDDLVMDVIQSPFSLLFIALFTLSILTFTRFRVRKPTPGLPPGPWKLPFIGNIHNLIGSLPHHGFHRLSLKYGPVMHLQLGELPFVVVSSPETAKKVMKTHYLSFPSRPNIVAAEIMAYGGATVVFSPYGEYWRQMKKFLLQEFLSPVHVHSFRSVREHVYLGVCRSLALKQGCPVNFSEMLDSAIYKVVSMSALGKVTKDVETLLEISKKILPLASGFDIVDLYPSFKLLHGLSSSKHKLLKYHEEQDVVLDRIIMDQRLKMGDESEKQNVVHALLKHQDASSEFQLTTDNIKAMITEILAGSTETSSTTSDWAMFEMMRNHEILNRAQQEVRELFDDKGCVDESGVDQLKYLQAVINETLRLHPPTPLLNRICKEPCEINGYKIPLESIVIINAWAINRDPSIWQNPDSFQPERFLENAVDYKGNNFEYLPFGGGRRICPGITFGISTVLFSLAVFLYYFDWKLPSEIKPEEMDMAETLGVTVARKRPLVIVPLLNRALPV